RDGAMYPESAVRIMPGPVGLPRVSVTPEVSECRRMPCSLRRVSTAASAWPPSWAMVIRPRDNCHDVVDETITRAANADRRTAQPGGSCCAVVRWAHTSLSDSIGLKLAGKRPFLRYAGEAGSLRDHDP